MNAQMNKVTTIWVISVKHIEHNINNDLNDIDDCKMKCYSFISSFNNLHCKYANVQSFILFKTAQEFVYL